MSASEGAWECQHGVDGRDWCEECHKPSDSNTPSEPNTDVREIVDERLDADLQVVRDALVNPHLWSGSDLAVRAFGRIENAVRLRMVTYPPPAGGRNWRGGSTMFYRDDRA